MSHTCPAPGCETTVSTDKLACPPHWFSIPKPMRNAVWDTYRGPGPGSAEHTAAIGTAIDYLRRAAPKPES